jgi:glutamate-1-semialdehyde 2,1-aminomutase
MTTFANSQELFARAQQLIPGGVNSPVRAFGQVGGSPIYFDSARGSCFTDADGNTYADFCQSWGPLILGHARAEVVDAVREAASRGLSYGACHANEIELAQLILDGFHGFDRARMVSSGTEAVMTALRVARGATGRELVVKFGGGYHGHYDGMLVKAGSGLVTQGIASSQGVPEAIAATTIVANFDDDEAIEQLFRERGAEIAAVIIEPLPANNGLLVQRPEFPKFLRDITHRYGALLIFDEVISGFRLRYGGYGHSLGIEPDLITLGKIIGGGMPLGAVVGKASQLDLLAPVGPVYQAGTLSGNPVSAAAGIATLSILKNEPDMYKQIDALGKRLVDGIAQSGLPFARAQRVGSIVWLYFDENEFPRRADFVSEVAMHRFTQLYWPLVRRGYYLPPSSYEVLFISAAHTQTEIDGLAAVLRQELAELQ